MAWLDSSSDARASQRRTDVTSSWTEGARRLAAAALFAVLVPTGAAQADDNWNNSEKVRAALLELKTESPQEIKERWGVLGDAAGNAYAGEASGRRVWRRFQWVVPGAAMEYEFGYCTPECEAVPLLLQYNPATKKIDFYQDDDLRVSAAVEADGSVTWRALLLFSETLRSDSSGGLLVDRDLLPKVDMAKLYEFSGGASGDNGQPKPDPDATRAVQAAVAATGLTPADLRKRWGVLLDALDQRYMHVKGKDVQWRAYEWLEPGQAVRVWSVDCNWSCGQVQQTTVRHLPEGVLEMRYSIRPDYVSYGVAQLDGKIGQKFSKAGKTFGRWAMARNGDMQIHGTRFKRVDAETLAKATGGKSAGIELGAANGTVVAAAAPATAVSPASGGKAAPAALVGTLPAARPPAGRQPAPPGAQAFPEALFVCSRPDASGQFTCDSPEREGIAGESGSTPLALVAEAGEVCPSRRRLFSRTHLVWGCGVGATGAPGFEDRGQGVDVRGRGTYQCLPQEPGCRRADL
jgi:hypothetical protein